MATVTAFIRSSSPDRDKPTFIRFRLTDGRDVQIFYKSSLSIAPKFWSNETQSIKARVSYNEKERLALNTAVAKIKEKIEKWYISLPDKSTASTASLRTHLACEVVESVKPSDFTQLFRRFMEDRRLSVSRKKHMCVTMREIQRFERYRTFIDATPYIFDVRKVTPNDIRQFDKFLQDEHRIYAAYPELYEGHKKPEPRGRNTILLKLTFLRTFFRWLREEGISEQNPFRGIKMDDEVYGTPVYLTKEELRHLAEYPFEDKAMGVQRDIFIFQSCVGCRYSDLVKFTGKSVVNGCVEYIARKTREDRPVTVRVPLNKTANELLERYRPEKPNAPLFPFYENQSFNRIIKRICQEAGLDRWVQVLDTLTREPTQKRLYEVVTSHTARKNFIGNIFSVVREQSLVSSLTGHKPGSKAFARYRTIDDHMKRDMVAILDE